MISYCENCNRWLEAYADDCYGKCPYCSCEADDEYKDSDVVDNLNYYIDKIDLLLKENERLKKTLEKSTITMKELMERSKYCDIRSKN